METQTIVEIDSKTDRDNKNASTLKKLAGLIQRNLHKRTKLKKKEQML